MTLRESFFLWIESGFHFSFSTEGGGSQPERPDTPIDIEIPFVAESEEAIADKVRLTNAFL